LGLVKRPRPYGEEGAEGGLGKKLQPGGVRGKVNKHQRETRSTAYSNLDFSAIESRADEILYYPRGGGGKKQGRGTKKGSFIYLKA